MVARDVILQIAPRAREDYLQALEQGNAVLDASGINTSVRLAAFLATICHETGGLTIVRENMNYTAKNLVAVFPTRYKGRPDLAATHAGKPKLVANFNYGFRMGNEVNGIDDDDGWRYRGGGFIQLTGRNSYRAAGLAIGVNLESQPELIEQADIALKAAAWEFSQYLDFCDRGEKGFRSVCNGINRGNPLSKLDPIGWADRQVWYARCCAAIGVGLRVEDDVLSYGDQGAMVEAAQRRLNELGYLVGRVDGIYGSRTRSAVMTFQAENKLTTDGIIGPQTGAALNAETAIAMPLGERAEETSEDLLKAGSATIATAKAIQNTASAGGSLSGVVGVASTVAAPAQSAPESLDLIKATKDVVTEISSWKVITNALSDTVVWATSHWWILAIVLAFAFWRWGRNIEFSRLKDHQLGLNLGR